MTHGACYSSSDPWSPYRGGGIEGLKVAGLQTGNLIVVQAYQPAPLATPLRQENIVIQRHHGLLYQLFCYGGMLETEIQARKSSRFMAKASRCILAQLPFLGFLLALRGFGLCGFRSRGGGLRFLGHARLSNPSLAKFRLLSVVRSQSFRSRYSKNGRCESAHFRCGSVAEHLAFTPTGGQHQGQG